ncbi:MAG: phytoene/squalene synthase family protein [Bacteroidales bacterium]|nr:phytoene/squalene synthase family protein [Bacteroidales bacterium]MBN2763185.1 phytoene/squalene synthase family protein [Bacteroidales bacterium]
MKKIFDEISIKTSSLITLRYSTSFSMGIKLLHKSLRDPIFAIYGFVRLGDEIVDSFHGFDQKTLFYRFKEDVYAAIRDKISLNPVLNSFQHVVHQYHIDSELIDAFIKSMELDLYKKQYDAKDFKEYILGSAEVVGLMCLKVFCNSNSSNAGLYDKLKEKAMKLGSAYQKINFLRDIQADHKILGRNYFPGINMEKFSESDKKNIEQDIEKDFREGLEGIKLLPAPSKFGVYLSYVYYFTLFKMIKQIPASLLLKQRFRIPDYRKYILLCKSWITFKLGII